MALVERSYSKKNGSRNSAAAAARAARQSFQAGGLWYKERHPGRARAGSAGVKNTNGAT